MASGNDQLTEQIIETDTGIDICCAGIFTNRLGFARYIPHQGSIKCSEVSVYLGGSISDGFAIESLADIPTDLIWFARYVEVFKPSVVLVPSIHSQPLMDICSLLGVRYASTPLQHFDAFKACQMLSELWPSVSYERMRSRINFSHSAMCMCLNGLFEWLSRCDSHVSDVIEVPPMNVLYMDQSTCSALQLLRTEQHPCDFQGIGSAKEGVSLFSLVDFTQSKLGRALLRQWFLLPPSDPCEIKRRHRVVKYFASSDHQEVVLRLRKHFRGLHPVGRLFTKMREGIHNLADYENLLRTIRSFVSIYETIYPIAHELDELQYIIHSCDVDTLRRMQTIIEYHIDLKGEISSYFDVGMLSSPRSTVHIRSGVNPHLDELRSAYQQLPSLLSGEAQLEASRCDFLSRILCIQCLHVPQYGFLLAVPLNELPFSESCGIGCSIESDNSALPVDQRSFERQFYNLSGSLNWSFRFLSDGLAFFKTPRMDELDERVGNLRNSIRDVEKNLMQSLDAELLSLSPSLIPLHTLAELDCLLSFAYVSFRENWCAPTLSDVPGTLIITGGYHPLLAKTRKSDQSLVPFSISITKPSQRINVITGANGSGKSVLLSAIAHIIFLFHVGCFVPSVNATIPLIGGFLTGYANNTSWDSRYASSFSSELLAVSRSLRRCQAMANLSTDEQGGNLCQDSHPEVKTLSRLASGASSKRCMLFLVDEFGKGTLPFDGQALLSSTISYLVSLGEERPICFFTTHFTDMLDDNFECGENRDAKPISYSFPFNEVQITHMWSLSSLDQDALDAPGANRKNETTKTPAQKYTYCYYPTYQAVKLTRDVGRNLEDYRSHSITSVCPIAKLKEFGVPDFITSTMINILAQPLDEQS